MKSYEEIIKDYVAENADVLNEKSPTKRGIIKFSEAVSRAILERKIRDTGYGDLAESLASAGLSGSGYADYIKGRADANVIGKTKTALDEKMGGDEMLDYEIGIEKERLEKKRLEEKEKEKKRLEELEKKRLEKEEKEKAAAEKKEAERLEKERKELEKNKKTVLSFANANNVTDASVLYNYAISLGLEESDAKEISESASKNVSEKLRVKNIEKAREHIVTERFTRNQAYAYALSLGLSERDALELAYFAYEINQDTSNILDYEGVREPPKNQAPPKNDIKHKNKLETKTE